MSKNYEVAKELYAQIGVDTEKAIETLNSITISMNCWQGDDLGGYEIEDGKLSSGGIQATGNYPGRPKTLEQLKADPQKSYGTDYPYRFVMTDLTPTPAGYQPFYISHYARHGSRYYWSADLYKNLDKQLTEAHEKQNLTAEGGLKPYLGKCR